ncbi:MAG: fatty acyl-AMP ligase [Timaviella obliquedivisa GSE-PSE-MK23-08B]|jgi:acyl-CoA synthetase (AMP-forming)/AMP-acid ligase II|nr:fatty acyl-AMP ligase [Timaviella obliquedivisa GSE-PSE-MK23-08B]
MQTVVDLLRHRAQVQANQTAYIFLKNGELAPTLITYAELAGKAEAIATHLAPYATERALLIYSYESGLEFITAFYACLCAGVIAVPCHPPRNQQDFTDLQARLTSAQAKIILTEAALHSKLRPLTPQSWIITNQLASVGRSPLPLITAEHLAFLQYTSGSTGIPKGVMVTHACIRSNQKTLEIAFGSNPQTISVGWLPLFHDMGLIGNILQPLHLGIPSILMSPLAFIQKPVRWLQALSHYQATTSGAPNFAYDLLCRQTTPQQRQTLDLSHWEVAFTGAEPIRTQTLSQFAATFAPCGFRSRAFYPCYGMAEATLLITGSIKTEPPTIIDLNPVFLKENRAIETSAADPEKRSIISCGRPWLDTQIVIVDPQALKPCPSDQIGEIWVTGSGIGKGYWNLPEQTRQTFQATLTQYPDQTFLRTGDLGFLKNQELYITGRLKEILVFWGFNHYPQHIEQTAENCHPALRSNASAAFAVPVEGEEKLVIALEVDRHYRHSLDVETTVEAIRWAVFDQHFVDVYAIAFLKPGSLPKTSSGKIQRQTCQEKFLAQQLNLVAEWRSPQPHDITTLLKKYLTPTTHVRRYLSLLRSKLKRSLSLLLKR